MARSRSRSSSLFSQGSPLNVSAAAAPSVPPPSDFPAGLDPRFRALALQSHLQSTSSSPSLVGSTSHDSRNTSSAALVDSVEIESTDVKLAEQDPFDPKLISPELESIINLINAQQARCYYEGGLVFLKDLDNDGKPPADRQWREVYGQLAGTILSIWDSRDLERAASNSANGRATVKPTYINIADASFRAIDSLPAASGGADISNVIVLSTTFKNRFLLQFGSNSALTLWSSALRLSIFESVSLQEAYTGALLAARGSKLNGIKLLLQETKFKHQDWVLVRFGAGMPWTRCWAVVTPPGYKKKKKNKIGRIDFFESKKTKQKKQKPLATMTGGKYVYAVYPESSLLINQSTLLKMSGTIAVHDESTKGAPRDGFIFVMPEAHPGVYGFETLIRFLIPTLDAFNLYGRPQRFNADKSDMRSIMFGLPDPPSTRYMDLADVYDISSSHPFDDSWKEDTWRTALKQIIVQKIATGQRNVHRTLPSEPEHRTPPLPQGEINALGNKLHTMNLSIHRSAQSAASLRSPQPPMPESEGSSDNEVDDIVDSYSQEARGGDYADQPYQAYGNQAYGNPAYPSTPYPAPIGAREPVVQFRDNRPPQPSPPSQEPRRALRKPVVSNLMPWNRQHQQQQNQQF